MANIVKPNELESWQAYSDHKDCPICSGHSEPVEEYELCEVCRKPLNKDEIDKCEDCWILEDIR